MLTETSLISILSSIVAILLAIISYFFTKLISSYDQKFEYITKKLDDISEEMNIHDVKIEMIIKKME